MPVVQREVRLSDVEIAAIRTTLAEAAAATTGDTPAQQARDAFFAATPDDLVRQKTERLETWLGGVYGSHVASIARDTEPDGDGTYTTLRLTIGPELRVSQINEVLTGMRRHALDFVRMYGGRG